MRYLLIFLCALCVTSCNTRQPANMSPDASQHKRTSQFQSYRTEQGRTIYYPKSFYATDYQARYKTAKGWWNQ